MKKFLSFFIALSVVLITNAQQVLVKDSAYTNSGGTGVIYVNTYAYDASCRLSFSRNAFVDSATNEQTNIGEIDYDYYPDGTKFHIVNKYWNPFTNTYFNSSRETFTYTANKYVATDLMEEWNGIAWKNTVLETYTYTASNKPATDLTQQWYKNAWQDSFSTAYTYDAGDRVTGTLYKVWDATTKMLINDNQTLNTYDANEYLIKTVHQTWDAATSAWMQDDEITYYNNSSGLADSSLESASDTTSSKTYYTYYPSSSLVNQSTTYTYFKDELTGGVRGTYFYDSSSTVYKDSVTTELLAPPLYNTFTLYSGYGITLIKNGDGTIKELDFNETLYSPETAYYSTKTFYTYSPCNSDLPLTLLKFTGQVQNNAALLQWQTANEVNTSYFAIQRSTDGVHYTAIGKVAASGNSSAQQNYSYTDADIASLNTTKLYYRLAETDKDGAVTYSKVVPINLSLAASFIIYPNPVKDHLFVQVKRDAAEKAVVQITDMQGKVLQQQTQQLTAGVTSLSFTTSALANGSYILIIKGQKTEAGIFVKK